MTDAPDLDAQVTIARDDLRRLRDALPDLWAHAYAAEWQPDTGRHVHRHRSRPAWLTPGPVQLGWLEATRELARAHRAMLSRTDVPAGTILLSGTLETPVEQSPTLPLEAVADAAELLSGMLEWARGEDRAGRLAPPERSAVLEACGHARAAWSHVPEGFRGEDRRPRCANPPCEAEPRPGRRECQACARWRQRHGTRRPVEDRRSA